MAKEKLEEKVVEENRIIDTIVAGNEMDARLMLMQNKGLSLTAAISYINDIKGKLK